MHSWKDVHLVLTDHVDHPAVDEGEETLPFEIDQYGDDDCDDNDGGNDEDTHIEFDGAADDDDGEYVEDVDDEHNESDGYGGMYTECDDDDEDDGTHDISFDPYGY